MLLFKAVYFLIFKNIRTKSFDDNTKILENEMKKIIASSLVMLFVLAGCNTVKGIGEDVSSAGSAVSNTAEKPKMKSANTNICIKTLSK